MINNKMIYISMHKCSRITILEYIIESDVSTSFYESLDLKERILEVFPYNKYRRMTEKGSN